MTRVARAVLAAAAAAAAAVALAAGCTGSNGSELRPTPSGTSETGGGGVEAALGAELQRTLEQVRASEVFPGASAAVVLADGSLWAGASGYADVDTRRPATSHTIFALASMSKAFVSVLTTELVAEGALALDNPLARWLPGFPDAEHITILQLLTGTSGVTDDNEHPFTEVDDDPSRPWTEDEFLARVPPAVCPPGSCRSGNENAPFVLLGAVIERATGSTLAALYHRRFFGPLGLDEIFLQSEEPVRGDIASGSGRRIRRAPAEAGIAGAAHHVLGDERRRRRGEHGIERRERRAVDPCRLRRDAPRSERAVDDHRHGEAARTRGKLRVHADRDRLRRRLVGRP